VHDVYLSVYVGSLAYSIICYLYMGQVSSSGSLVSSIDHYYVGLCHAGLLAIMLCTCGIQEGLSPRVFLLPED
jgi:hypothetical protein